LVLIGVEFLQGEFIWQRHWAITDKIRIYSEENRVFWAKEFLIKGYRGKNGIKNYRDDYYEFRDFWWNFHDFWISGAIKINSEKIEQIKWIDQGLRSNQSYSGCNLGTETHLSANWGSQTYTHRIREERECDTCQHFIGPLQYHVSAPHWSTSARWAPPPYWPDIWAPPQCHVAASQWSTSPSLCHMAQPQEATSPLCATWHNHRKPPHPLCATWHHTTKPPHSACATWHNTTEPPQQLLTRSLMLKGSA
jgi:hypothetical protein